MLILLITFLTESIKIHSCVSMLQQDKPFWRDTLYKAKLHFDN